MEQLGCGGTVGVLGLLGCFQVCHQKRRMTDTVTSVSLQHTSECSNNDKTWLTWKLGQLKWYSLPDTDKQQPNMAVHFVFQHLDFPGSYVRILFLDLGFAFNTVNPALIQDNLFQLSVQVDHRFPNRETAVCEAGGSKSQST